MKMIELVAPCHFGMEAVLKREILDLGYEISQVEDGRVTFLGDLEAVAYANVFLRTTERILIKVGKIHAEKRRPLTSCLRKPRLCPGRILFPRTENSGWQRLTPSRVSFSALPISSPS